MVLLVMRAVPRAASTGSVVEKQLTVLLVMSIGLAGETAVQTTLTVVPSR